MELFLDASDVAEGLPCAAAGLHRAEALRDQPIRLEIQVSLNLVRKV
jgi:hypothetical protein